MNLSNKLLFILNIELGEGNSKKLHFYESDTPAKLAFTFCQQQKLDHRAYEFVLKNLEEKLNLVMKDKKHKSTTNISTCKDNLKGDLYLLTEEKSGDY